MTETKSKSSKTATPIASPSDVAAHETDTGSTAVQVASLTAHIAELTEHLKANKKDHMARRGLLVMVGKRKRLLKYLARTDSDAYLALIKKLNLRR